MRNDAKHLTEQFQAVLRLVDLSDEQMTMLLMWRDRGGGEGVDLSLLPRGLIDPPLFSLSSLYPEWPINPRTKQQLS
jgi:hypothetical protein